MSDESQPETRPEQEARPRLAYVEIGDWPGLGGTVGFDVSERVTVLVGKNGSGKSLVLDGLRSAAAGIRFGTSISRIPRYFQCGVQSTAPFHYQFEIKVEGIELVIDDENNDESTSERLTWNERCWRNDANLWALRNARLEIAQHPPIKFTNAEGLVANIDQDYAIGEELVPPEARDLAKIFEGVGLVDAGVPRSQLIRREILLKRTPKGWQAAGGATERTHLLAQRLLNVHTFNGGQFNEFVELMQQLGIVERVQIRTFDEFRPTANGDSYASIELDGVNLGFCSDGTQRMALIVAQLLNARTRCLLIEEPETAVHPSLLSRLLAIFDSYSHDKQIIIATHSPQIVDWCKPRDLRLVERIEGQTRVRKLDEGELGRVSNYLTHDGTLSDFIYRQSVE